MKYRIIKYGASWCQQCKLQDKEFERNPLKCPLYKVDIDELEEKEIESLNLKSIPVTILWIYEDKAALWTEIYRWVGFVKTEEINKIIDNHG